MRKVINGKMYNTETATLAGDYENMNDVRNFRYYKEELYQKKNGEWFLHGEGHGLSKYGVRQANEYSWGETIIPYTADEAKEWIETYGDVDTYIKCFGEPEE